MMSNKILIQWFSFDVTTRSQIFNLFNNSRTKLYFKLKNIEKWNFYNEIIIVSSLKTKTMYLDCETLCLDMKRG